MTKKRSAKPSPRPGPTSNWALPVLITIVLFAAALRFFQIDAQSYWHDEGNSRVLAARSLGEIWLAAAVDIHPPGYYVLLSGWRTLFGESEAALRGLSALAGAFTAGLTFSLARRRLGLLPATIAGGFVALNPFLVYYGQEARMYALLALWTVATFACADLIENAPWPLRATSERAALLGYLVAVVAGLYTHYAFGFVILAQFLLIAWDLVRGPGDSRRSALLRIGLLALSALLFAPWVPTALRQLSTWPAARDGSASPIELARWLGFGGLVTTGEAQIGVATLGATAAFGVIASLGLRPEAQRLARTAIVWFLLPATLTLSLGLLTPVFAKLLVGAVPALGLILALTFDVREQTDARRWVRPAMSGALLIAVVGTTLAALNNLYFDPAYARDDYRGIARHLRANQGQSDAVILIAPNQIEAFGYYYGAEPGDAPITPLPTTRPLGPEQTRDQLTELLVGHDRLWVLYWAQQQADPDGLVERWLAENAFPAGDRWFGGVRLATYGTAPTGARRPSGALFGDSIALIDSALSADVVQPGEQLSIDLRWQTNAPLEEDLKVFIHLARSPDEPPVAQHDSAPANGFAPTSGWATDAPLSDHHGLQIPIDVAPGVYQLIVGLTRPDGQRLPVNAATVVDRERVLIAEIRVP